jgi:adenylyl- and sulfurtransferase ThiI
LKFAIRRESLGCSRIEKEAARLVVFGTRQNDLAAAVCQHVFGVAYAAPALLLTKPTLDEIAQTILQLAEQQLSPGKSFAVRAHRSTPGSVARHDVELEGGSVVLRAFKDQGVHVDLNDPDSTFYVDMVGDDAYIYCRKLTGPGGLPLSAQWKMLAVLDTGPLSILAALAMMRRGCVVELLIPISAAIADLSSEPQLALARRVGRLVTRPNYKAFVMELEKQPHAGDAANVDWRDFVRVSAVKFARDNRFKGLIFGDISGDLSTFRTYPGPSPLPIFYPLLGMEEEDLTELLSLSELDDRQDLSKWGTSSGSSPSQSQVKSLVEETGVPLVREIEF